MNQPLDLNKLNVADSSNWSASIREFVTRRCEIFSYEATKVSFYRGGEPDTFIVRLTSTLQIPVDHKKVDVTLPTALPYRDVLQEVADELDAMHLGLTRDELDGFQELHFGKSYAAKGKAS